MTYRIELLFVGEAPEDELSRARILASPAVQEAMGALSKALMDEGFHHNVEAKTVRPGKRPKASGRPKLAAAE